MVNSGQLFVRLCVYAKVYVHIRCYVDICDISGACQERMVLVATQLSTKDAEKAEECEVEPFNVIIEEGKSPESENVSYFRHSR